MKRASFALSIIILTLAMVACGIESPDAEVEPTTAEVAEAQPAVPAFVPEPYAEASGQASPEAETRIELDDGATVIVPAASVSH